MPVGAVTLVALQWLFIFRTRSATLAASIGFSIAAWLIARLSLRHTETNVLYNLHAIAGGRGAMFKEID